MLKHWYVHLCLYLYEYGRLIRFIVQAERENENASSLPDV
jgi:hypothetical protein